MSRARQAFARRAIKAAMTAVRGTPHWVERAAAGQMYVHEPWCTSEERAAISQRRSEIIALRQRRQAARRHAPRPEYLERRVLWRGAVPLVIRAHRYLSGRGGYVRYHYVTRGGVSDGFRAPREAAREYLRHRTRTYGGVEVARIGYSTKWLTRWPETGAVYEYTRRPSRTDLVVAALTLPRQERYSRRPAPEVARG